MKASGIISAFIFAHAVLAQVTPSPVTGSASSAASPTTSASESTTKSSARSATKSASQSYSTPATASHGANNNPTGTSFPIAETQSSSSSGGDPLIPSSASGTCTTFLNQLNKDATVAGCLTDLLGALSAFIPSTGSSSPSAVSKTLNSLCSSNACPVSALRAQLTSFKDACKDELGSNDVVTNNYDVLYSLIPFKLAVCAKDADTQAYCVLNVGSGSSVGNTTQNIATGPSEPVTYAASHLANPIVSSPKRAQTVFVPNTDTYRNTNLMYLFTSPDMNAGQLCTSCTQQIISKYIAFESSNPYALGITNSRLLGAQGELWAAMQEKCPANFMTQVTNIAGVASADQMSGASPAVAGRSLYTALAGALAILALA